MESTPKQPGEDSCKNKIKYIFRLFIIIIILKYIDNLVVEVPIKIQRTPDEPSKCSC
jgi:hypothetical protein